jgi:tRNA 5-methylaminomethyl-2-thiouridine biosynthesis bifunctional protein
VKRLAANLEQLAIPPETMQVLNLKDLRIRQDLREQAGLLYPRARVVFPRKLVAAALGTVEVFKNAKLISVNASPAGAKLQFESSKEVQTAGAILCNSLGISSVKGCSWLKLEPVRGQVLTAVSESGTLTDGRALCYEGYCLPMGDARYLIGASFEHGNDSVAPSESVNDELRQRLADSLGWGPELRTTGTRVSFRASTLSRLPFVGGVPEEHSSKLAYADYYRGFRSDDYPECRHLPGVFLAAGLGSRGLTSSWLSAAVLRAQIFGDPLPVERHLILDRLNPIGLMLRKE